MRRWLAIPVAAIIAVAVGAVSWQGGAQPARAGVTDLRMEITCVAPDSGACTYNTGTTSVTVNVVLTNQSGGSLQLGGLGFDVTATNATTLVPTTPACDPSGLNCNPDFNQAAVTGAGWACSPPAPAPDNDASAGTANSSLGCFTASIDGPTLANSASLTLGSVSYTAAGDGVHALTLDTGTLASNVYNGDFSSELGSCPTISFDMTCTGITVQVGGSAATATPTNTPLPTNTAVPTNTPCSGASCPTPTSLAYKTVTPTGTITVGTPIPGVATTAPPPPPPPPPAGGAPDGTTAGGGRGGIRLPDTGTGTGTGTSANDTLSLFALMAIAVAAIAGGSLWHSMAAAANRRED